MGCATRNDVESIVAKTARKAAAKTATPATPNRERPAEPTRYTATKNELLD